MFEMSLKSMFTDVADRYDLLNRILTWTLDETWREFGARQCASGGVTVDLCCGTGDLSLHIIKHVSSGALVAGLDFNKAMLNKAVNKKRAEHDRSDINFILANAAHLPFKKACVDCIGISFSFRNLIYKNPQASTVLSEIVRSLQVGGKFVCVETSQPKRRSLRILYHLYLMKIVPLIGWIISRRKNAYRYLGMSATNFPSAEEISRMLLNAGFREVSFKRLTFGIVARHVGVK